MAQQVTFTLLSGDYPQRLLKLAEAAYAARNDKVELLANERHPAEVLAEEYEELRVKAEKAGTVVTLDAIGRKTWRHLKAIHPIRTEPDVDADTAKGDRLTGVNAESIEDDLLHGSLVRPAKYKCAGDQPDVNGACTLGNACSNRVAYTKWAEDDLSEGEFQQALKKAWNLSQSAVIDPKALPSWQIPSDDES